jgi:hypothetical protein
MIKGQVDENNPAAKNLAVFLIGAQGRDWASAIKNLNNYIEKTTLK